MRAWALAAIGWMLLCGAPGCSDDGGSGAADSTLQDSADSVEDAPDGVDSDGHLPDSDLADSDLADSDLADSDLADSDLADGGEQDSDLLDGAGLDATDAADASPDIAPDTSPDTALPEECWNDLAVGDKVIFAEGFTKGTEGIAFSTEGRLFVSELGTGQIWELDAEGQKTEFANVPTALGLAPRSAGGIWVASIGESNTKGVADGAVYYVSEDGEVQLVADGIDSPNFVVELGDGSVLVSDDFDERIWRVESDGTVSVAIQGIESPNGMALSQDRTAMWVASTFTAKGEVTRVPLDGKGLPEKQGYEVIAELGSAQFPDGMAIDSEDRVYVAVNLAGKIVRIPGAGDEMESIAVGMTNPASLAFGAGEGFDPCSIYVTELFGKRIWRVAVGAMSQ